MKVLVAAAFAALSVLALTAPDAAAAKQSPVPAERPMQLAMACFKTGEERSGLNKICYYNCAGSPISTPLTY